MNIIVTGASGFIGKNLLLELPKSWSITALYNKNTGFPDFVARNCQRNITPIRCDLTKDDEVKKLASDLREKFDVCVFLAANGDPVFSVEHPAADLEMTTLTLVNFLHYFKIEKLIYFSSGAVYEGLKGLISPEVLVKPKLPYAISHLASEEYVKFFASRGTVNDYVILRFFGAYGPYEPSRKIFTRLIETCYCKDSKEFRVRGDGKNYIDAMYVDDAVKGVLKVIESKQTNVVVDFCKGEPLMINDLVVKVASLLKSKNVTLKHCGQSDEYIEFHASPAKMDELFKFQPKIDLNDGLSKFVQFLKDRGAT